MSRLRPLLVTIAFLEFNIGLAGCVSTPETPDDLGTDAPDARQAGDGPAVPGDDLGSAGNDCAHPPGRREDLVCWHWRCDRADQTEGLWSGSSATCEAGDITASGRTNTLKLVNIYRFLAALPPVTSDATKDKNSQQCALMMDANMRLSHFPDMSWKCYTPTGAMTAGISLAATWAAVAAVDAYMIDAGNAADLAHRRWILSSTLGPIGVGSTSRYSCMSVVGGSGRAMSAWTAWPPPGPSPIAMWNPRNDLPSLDSTGWSLQSDSIDLSAARVEVKDGSQVLPVNVAQLGKNYGSLYALSFVPQGWQTKAGHSYSVTVTGISQPISYTVEPTACP